jgi:cytochrome c553
MRAAQPVDLTLLPRFHVGWRARILAVALALTLAHEARAQDAVRGAQLYIQLPTVPSCVSCHGPDPSQNRNNLLRAGNDPLALQKALNNVGAMGYLKSLLDDTDVADLAAYLGRVAAVGSAGSPVAVWPTTLEFGAVAVGSVSPVHRLQLLNQQAEPLPLAPPRLVGPGAAQFTTETDCPASLPPAATCSVRLRAQPLASGRAAATVVLQSGASAPWVTGVSVTGLASAIGVLSTDLSSPSIEFAELAVGESATREFRLLSHGTQPATLGAITLTGPSGASVRLEGECARAVVLAPGTGCTLRLRLVPTAVGPALATLQIRSDAANPETVALTGSVRAAAPTAPGATPPAPTSPTAPTAPSPTTVAEPAGDGGGCSAGPPVRRVDPTLPFAMLLAAGLLLRRRVRAFGDSTLQGLRAS